MGPAVNGRDTLYLGSQSKPRQQLLKEVGIFFKILTHQSTEEVATRDLDFFGQVLAIAQNKMDHLDLPDKSTVEKERFFVVTADTLVRTVNTNQVFGKPESIQDAKRMLTQIYDQRVEVATACCLELKAWEGNKWKVVLFMHWVSEALIEFKVPADEIDNYLEKVPEALHSSGAGIVEGYGQNYFKSIQGSYAATKGLPIYELRQALIEFGFIF